MLVFYKVNVFVFVALLATSVVLHLTNVISSARWRMSAVKLDRTLCQPNKAFQDIVLVIIFSKPIYSHVPMLLSFYKKAFPTNYLCGPESSLQYGVHKVDILRGFFGYECLAIAIRQLPNYDGYLFVNDDMIINYWNLVRLDKTKIWEGPKTPITLGSYGPPRLWFWWKSRWGMRRCNETFHEILDLVMRKTEAESSLLFEKALKVLKRNMQFLEKKYSRTLSDRYFCTRGRSDIFFLPGNFGETFTLLSDIFRKHDVFHEIALPTIARMLHSQKHFQRISGIYLPGRAGSPPVSDSKYLWTVYDTSMDFIHPIKLNGSDKHLNKALFINWIQPYSETQQLCLN